MISHKHKSIFVHIPKVAGQSIESFFLQDENLTWEERSKLLLRKNRAPKKGPPRLAHLTAKQYCEYNYISKNKFEDYYKFSFVRNPWSRVVSFYKYLGYNTLLSFDDFVLEQLPILEKQNKYFFGSQYYYLTDEKGELLVDYVGKFEKLQEDFNVVCKELKFEESKLPYANKTKRKRSFYKLVRIHLSIYKKYPLLIFKHKRDDIISKDYKDYYTNKEIIDCVASVYKDDIAFFGYDKV